MKNPAQAGFFVIWQEQRCIDPNFEPSE